MITKIGLYRDPRKNRQWVVRWFGEYDPNAGKHKRYSKSFNLKRDAEAFQSQLTLALKEGQQRDRPEEVALGDFCEDWLRIRSANVKPATLKLYSDTIERLYGYFGRSCQLSKLTPHLAATFLADLRPADSTRRHERLSNWTKHRILRNCKTMFGGAVTWQLLCKNPFQSVMPPKLTTTRWHYVKPDEYLNLLEVAPSLRWRTCYALAYTAGLRFGELFSLTWSDIDFETSEVRIDNRPATSTMPPFDVKDYEARRIPLPRHTIDILVELHNEAPDMVPYVLLTERLHRTVVAKWRKCQQDNRPWKNQDMANNVLREFKRHLRQTSIQQNGTLSIHTLRKSCIQNWANELPINVTKELAGHSSIATTQRYYLQVDEYHRAKAAAVIDSLIANGRNLQMTDARLTPDGNFTKKNTKY
jgi:integrase